MELMWQTQEVIRRIEEDADVEEIKELIEEAEARGRDPEDAVRKWAQSGAAPKGLHDAIYRFCTEPARAYAFVEWDEVVQHFAALEV